MPTSGKVTLNCKLWNFVNGTEQNNLDNPPKSSGTADFAGTAVTRVCAWIPNGGYNILGTMKRIRAIWAGNVRGGDFVPERIDRNCGRVKDESESSNPIRNFHVLYNTASTSVVLTLPV